MTEQEPNKKIAIMCSANDLPERYTSPAVEFATLLPENHYDLVWGGSDSGLMKLVASAVQENGGRIIGVTMAPLAHVARANADEMIVEEDLGSRKAKMLKLADAIAILVGGIGTLDEVTDMLEHKKHGRHSKPIVVLNTKEFYGGLKTQMTKMKQEGFIKPALDDLIVFVASPQEAIAKINSLLGTN